MSAHGVLGVLVFGGFGTYCVASFELLRRYVRRHVEEEVDRG